MLLAHPAPPSRVDPGGRLIFVRLGEVVQFGAFVVAEIVIGPVWLWRLTILTVMVLDEPGDRVGEVAVDIVKLGIIVVVEW